MNKTELIKKVAEVTGVTKKDTEKVVNGVLETIQDVLESEDSVAILGFGTFLVRQREAREGRNPKTGEPIMIPASKVVVFRPGKTLKETVAGRR